MPHENNVIPSTEKENNSVMYIYRPIHLFSETVVDGRREIIVEIAVKNSHTHHNLKLGVRLTPKHSACIRFDARFGVGVLQKGGVEANSRFFLEWKVKLSWVWGNVRSRLTGRTLAIGRSRDRGIGSMCYPTPNPRVDALSCRMGCVLFGLWGFNKKGVGL